MSDLIDRQAAIDEIDEWIIAFWVNGHKESAADARLIQDGIIQLPSAQPRKKKWISLDDFRGKYNTCGYKCSECGEHSEYEENFCPNCGADMRGRGDSDE